MKRVDEGSRGFDAGAFENVLEDNLQRLLTRAWVPVAASAEFRSRLTLDLEARALGRASAHADRAGTRAETASLAIVAPMTGALKTAQMTAAPRTAPRTVQPPARAWSRRAFAAAAAVLAVAAIWFAFARSNHGAHFELRDVLARNCVAVREAGSSGWRALDAREADRGLDVGAIALEVATPDTHDVRLRFGSSGRATLAASAAVEARTSASTSTSETVLALSAGALSVERYDAGAVWALTGCDARIELERGAIELSIVDASTLGSGSTDASGTPSSGACLVAELTRGAARAWIDGAPSPLSVGMRIALRSGRALETRAVIDDPIARSARAPAVAAGSEKGKDPGAPSAVVADADRAARLEARLLPPSGVARPPRITVTMLRHERLPAVSQPITQELMGSERFTIDGLRAGTYDVFVETAGFAVWRVTDVVLTAGAARNIDVQLAPGLALRGRVVDANGAPIEGAIVLSEDDVPSRVIPFAFEDTPGWSAVATTLSDGTFELLHLHTGTCVLRATHAGFGAAWSAPVDPERASDALVLRLSRGGSVIGHVARDDGSAWTSAIIIASHIGREETGSGAEMARMGYGLAHTDAEGAYRIDDLPGGSFVVLNALDVANSSSVRQATIIAGQTVTIDLPERASGARVTGTLFDAEGKTLADKDVTLQPSGSHERTGWRSMRSDAHGQFTFSGVPEGSFDVFVGTDMGRRFVHQDRVDVPASGEVVHDVHLDAGRIEGLVVRSDNADPCKQCFLLIQEKRADGYTFAGIDFTDASGEFTLEHLRNGTWRIEAYPSERGFAPLVSDGIVVTHEAPAAHCTLVAQRGAALRVTVRDADGHALAGVDVSFQDAVGNTLQLTARDVTGPAGVLDVPGIAAGKWTLSARVGGRASAPVTFDFVPGDEREIELLLPR